jgi:hypothetical protein
LCIPRWLKLITKVYRAPDEIDQATTVQTRGLHGAVTVDRHDDGNRCCWSIEARRRRASTIETCLVTSQGHVSQHGPPSPTAHLESGARTAAPHPGKAGIMQRQDGSPELRPVLLACPCMPLMAHALLLYGAVTSRINPSLTGSPHGSSCSFPQECPKCGALDS